jgi:hypothetical protein
VFGKVGDMPPKQVVGMARNGWTTSIGIAGRHGPDYALGYSRPVFLFFLQWSRVAGLGNPVDALFDLRGIRDPPLCLFPWMTPNLSNKWTFVAVFTPFRALECLSVRREHRIDLELDLLLHRSAPRQPRLTHCSTQWR